MKDLIELVNIVTRTKLRHVELFNSSNGTSGESKIQQFYDLISEGQFEDDDEAANYFYGKDKRTPGYQKLRKTLKDRLINSLFIIDLKRASYTSRQKAYYETYKDWAAVKILIGKNAFATAEGIIRQIIKIARRYEFTELLVDIYHMLRLYYGTIWGNTKKFLEYNQSFKKYQEIWIAENKVEEYYIDLSIQFIHSKSTKASLQKKALAYEEAIRCDMEKYDSYQLQLCGWLIRLSVFSVVNDYQKTLDVCSDAIAFFKEKEYTASVPLQVFLYQKCVCLGQLRAFDELQGCIEECLSYIEEGKLNWFKLHELKFLFYTHNKKYHEAFALLQKIVEHDQFEDLPGSIKEIWRISEAYLVFLIKAGVFGNTLLEPESVSDFRLSKFLNDLEIFTKDKTGMNVPVLIAEFLLKLVSGKQIELIDREESINKYRNRYLKDDLLIRSNLFLQMLLQISKNSFEKDLVIEKTKPIFQDLISIPIETANQSYEIEIIPYEELWEIVLKQLD